MRVLRTMILAAGLAIGGIAASGEALAGCGYNVLGERVCNGYGSDSGSSSSYGSYGSAGSMLRSGSDSRWAADQREADSWSLNRKRESNSLMREIERDERGSGLGYQPTTTVRCPEGNRSALCYMSGR